MTDQPMRRQEREVLAADRVAAIIAAATIARVGFVDAGEAYVVPLNFGCEFTSDLPVRFWFHSAPEGRKARLVRARSRACVQIDVDRGLVTHADHACAWTQRYESVMAWGLARPAADAAEQHHGLEVLMRDHAGRDGWTYPATMLARTLVWCVEVDRLTAKAHLAKTTDDAAAES